MVSLYSNTILTMTVINGYPYFILTASAGRKTPSMRPFFLKWNTLYWHWDLFIFYKEGIGGSLVDFIWKNQIQVRTKLSCFCIPIILGIIWRVHQEMHYHSSRYREKKLKMEEHGGRANKVYKDESISINRYPIKRQISLHIRKPLTLVFFWFKPKSGAWPVLPRRLHLWILKKWAHI